LSIVPFVVEYLLGSDVMEVWPDPDAGFPLRQGSGAIVTQADDTGGFAHALEMLLANDGLQTAMGQSAYHITIPHFTWLNMVTLFLEGIAPNPEQLSGRSRPRVALLAYWSFQLACHRMIFLLTAAATVVTVASSRNGPLRPAPPPGDRQRSQLQSCG
jgi:Na+/proline symporter